jgi:hypothetical protein
MKCGFNPFRLIEKEAANFKGRGIKRDHANGSPPASPRVKRRKKRKDDDAGTDEESEVAAFRARPTAAVNKPMLLQPIDRVRKSQIDLSLATVDPNASFEDRVAQFDNMEAIAKKREIIL